MSKPQSELIKELQNKVAVQTEVIEELHKIVKQLLGHVRVHKDLIEGLLKKME